MGGPHGPRHLLLARPGPGPQIRAAGTGGAEGEPPRMPGLGELAIDPVGRPRGSVVVRSRQAFLGARPFGPQGVSSPPARPVQWRGFIPERSGDGPPGHGPPNDTLPSGPPAGTHDSRADPMALRFRPRMRIRSGADFSRAFSQGGRARGDVLVVIAHENGGLGPRMGLSVGKRIWRHAVDRNRVRRIFREAFRLSQARLPADHDLVLVPAHPKLRPKLEQTAAELVRLARKAAERRIDRREGRGREPRRTPTP